MAADRQYAHDLLDRLGPDQLAAAVHLLETIASPKEERDTLSQAERHAAMIRERRGWAAGVDFYRPSGLRHVPGWFPDTAIDPPAARSDDQRSEHP